MVRKDLTEDGKTTNGLSGINDVGYFKQRFNATETHAFVQPHGGRILHGDLQLSVSATGDSKAFQGMRQECSSDAAIAKVGMDT